MGELLRTVAEGLEGDRNDAASRAFWFRAQRRQPGRDRRVVDGACQRSKWQAVMRKEI